MRARVKKRQLYRRVTIVAVVLAVLVLLVVGFYFAYESSNVYAPSDGKPVLKSDLTALQQSSLPPYGPSNPSMLTSVKDYNGAPLTAYGKPLLVYIGADYCEYCAAQRWSLVLSLMRFGNLTGLKYMSSSVADGDYVTFTFENASYASKYFVFEGFEQKDRLGNPLQNVPTNYTAAFDQYGTAYPFLNFGNRYVISGALWLPSGLAGDNWTAVLKDIKATTPLGTQIKEGANVITALICKLTGNQPSSVCGQSPINGITISISSYQPASLGTVNQNGTPTASGSPWATSSAGWDYKQH